MTPFLDPEPADVREAIDVDQIGPFLCGDAREVAAVIALLAGSDASYVTGASWSVDGGILRMGPQAGSHLGVDDWRRP